MFKAHNLKIRFSNPWLFKDSIYQTSLNGLLFPSLHLKPASKLGRIKPLNKSNWHYSYAKNLQIMIRSARNKICTVHFGVLLRVALYMFQNHWPSRIRYLVFIKLTQMTIFQLFENFTLLFSVTERFMKSLHENCVSYR